MAWDLPDTFFQRDASDPAQAERENRETFLQSEAFQVDETSRIKRPVAILVGAEIIRSLVKNDLFIDFCQEDIRNSLTRRNGSQQPVLHSGQRACHSTCCVASKAVGDEPFSRNGL